VSAALNRVPPKMPAAAYQTYAVVRPKRTHWRKATCQQVECPHWLKGWRQTIDLNTPLGQEQARYIKQHSGRAYTKIGQFNGVVELEFPAGQQCFTEHRVPLDRDSLFQLKGGDWRGNPAGVPTRTLSPVAWRDNYGENQEKLAEIARRG
jgi:hypothetical protein